MTESNRGGAPDSLTLSAPARLHMGFLDPSGTLGRFFGSIGVSLNEIETRIILRLSERLLLPPEHHDRCEAIVQKVSEGIGRPVSAEIIIDDSIPEHVGLGSGTQFALALGLGLHRLHQLNPSVREIAHLIGRGRRSGVGIAAFEQGGFIVDGGHGRGSLTPPLLARLPFPESWRFILAFDRRGGGLHGEAELAAFKALPRFPEADAARICHLVMLRGLPALCESDLETFGDVITDIQRSIGDYFAPAQGGRFTSRDVQDAMEWLAAQGAVGIGQTSWGPTGFCLVGNPDDAERLADKARAQFFERTNLTFLVASARNQGAQVQPTRAGEEERLTTRHSKALGRTGRRTVDIAETAS